MVFLPGIPSTRRFAKAQNLQRNYMRRVSTNSFHLPLFASVCLAGSHNRGCPRIRGGRGRGGVWRRIKLRPRGGREVAIAFDPTLKCRKQHHSLHFCTGGRHTVRKMTAINPPGFHYFGLVAVN